MPTSDLCWLHAREASPEARARAALLLAESTLHLLIEAGVLTPDQAIQAAQTAAEVGEEAGESMPTLRRMELSFKGAMRPG